MPTSSAFRIRFAIVGIFSMLALGFILSPSNAQPPFPGQSPFPRPPSFPRPSFPKPPPIPPIRPPATPGFPGMPGAGGSIHDEWYCSGCKFVIGRGPVKPVIASCPSCGARFSNGLTLGGVAPLPSMPRPPAPAAPDVGSPGSSAPPAAPPGGNEEPPPLPTNPAAGSPARAETPPAQPTPDPSPTADSNPVSAPSDDSPAPEPKSRRSRMIKAIGIVVGAIILIGMLAALAFVVTKANTPVKRPKRRKVFELDDD